jgi:type VI secretion system protein ImpF
VSARRQDRHLPPILHIFREAHVAHDAKKKVELRDEDGARILSGRRVSARQPVSEDVLRRDVAAHLSALLNTIRLGAAEDLSPFERVQSSILNFGIDDIASITIEERRMNDIPNEIRTVILTYEKRLVPRSVVVTRDTSVAAENHEVRFNVRGELRSEPLNIPVEFIAELERGSAKFRIERL